MSNAMPKFDFSKASIKSNADLEALTQRKPGKEDTSKVMRPGRHEVTIAGVEFKGMAPNDPSWAKFSVLYQGTGAKQIRDMILVPTSEITYGVEKKLFPYRKLTTLLKSLGRPINVETLGQDLSSIFGESNALVGSHVAVNVGYTKAHVKYVRNDIGESSVQIVLKDKTTLLGDNGKSLSFPDADAAEAHMQQNNIAFDKFPSVLSYEASTTSNKATDSNW